MEVPIVNRGIPDEKNGRVILHGQNPKGEGWDQVYSFTYYYLPGIPLKGTKYYWGLSSYIEMINTFPFIGKTGVIIYTNPLTMSYLQEAFPLDIYPNLLFAITHWPYFSNEEGNLDLYVLRTMRYHAVEHFRGATVHMRDSDTIFPSIFDSPIEDEFTTLLTNWESVYSKFVGALEAAGKQIVLGSVSNYKKNWHSNLVYPVDFPFPFQKISENDFLADIKADKHLFVSRPNFIKPMRYSLLFDTKYFFTPKIGVFAGFSTVMRNRDGIENFWQLCVEYLVSRYYSTIPVFSTDGKRRPTNWQIQSVFEIGKDERMLLYAIIPNFFEKIYFLTIDYNPHLPFWNIKNSNQLRAKKNYRFFFPEYFDKFAIDGSDPSSMELQALFQAQRTSYQEWLEKFKATYPTEKAFLNSVNENLEFVVPNNGKTYKTFEKYGKKVIRHGGGRRQTRSNLRMKKRSTKKRR